MKLIFFEIPVGAAGGKILYNISAEIDIDDLQTAADAENGFPGLNKGIQNGELRPVKLWVYGERTPVFLTEEPGMDISSAGKQQPVTSGSHSGVETCNKGDAAGSEGGFVIFGVLMNTRNKNTHMMIRVSRTGLFCRSHFC